MTLIFRVPFRLYIEIILGFFPVARNCSRHLKTAAIPPGTIDNLWLGFFAGVPFSSFVGLGYNRRLTRHGGHPNQTQPVRRSRA